MGYFSLGGGTPSIVVPSAPTLSAGLLAKMSFWGDYKKTQFQTIDNGLALYQDPAYPSIKMEQDKGSQQPTLDADGWLFDANNQQFLDVSDTSSAAEFWGVANSADDGVFGYYRMIMSDNNSNYIYGGQSVSYLEFNGNQPNLVDNDSNTSFAPLGNTRSVALGLNGASNANIGNYLSSYYFWNGHIKSVMYFNTSLTSTERTELQEYLKLYYNF